MSGPVLFTVTAALAPSGGDMARYANASGYSPSSSQRLNVGAGHAWHYLDGSQGGTFSKAATVEAFGLVDGGGAYLVEITTAAPYSDGEARPTLVQIKTTSALTPAPPPEGSGGGSSEDVAAAVADRDAEWVDALTLDWPVKP